MARIIRTEAIEPVKIDPRLLPGAPTPAPNVIAWPRDEQGQLKAVFVCACGLSSKHPFCDGSHKLCRDEAPGFIHEYDPRTKLLLERRPDNSADRSGEPGGSPAA